MDKSPEAFRTISEVADALDVPPHVLRFWETRFTQVKPVKRGGGRRYYRPEDVRLLRGVRGLLYDDGMTIKGVQKILREKGIRHVIALGTLPESESAADVEAVPAPQPAAGAAARKPAAAEAAHSARPARPQADLFGEPAAEVLTATTAEKRSGGADRPAEDADVRSEVETKAAPAGNAKSLKALVAELEALRAEMSADPKR